MKFQRVLVLLLGLLSSAPYALGEECRVVLGALLPLTGPGASLGERAVQAMELAEEKLDTETREKLVLKFEDTSMQAGKAASALQNLLRTEDLGALIATYAETAAMATPVVEREHLPTFMVSPDRRPFAGKRYAFHHWVTGEQMTPILAQELKRRGISSLSLVYSEHPAQSHFASVFSPALPQYGLELLYSVSVLPHETDLRSVIAAALRKNPQAVVFFLLPPQPSAFAKQLRQLNPTIPLFAFINTESSSEVRAAEGSLEGVVYPAPNYQESFVQEFQSRYKHYPEGPAANCADAVSMIGLAIRSGACTRQAIHEFLLNLKSFNGVFGNYGINDKNEFTLPVGLKTIRNGSFEFIHSRER